MAFERNANQHEPVSGIDGVLCPVCGVVVKELPVLVHRVIGDDEERFRVCSTECRQNALRSHHLQMSLFGGNLRVWSRSRQAALDLIDRDNGDGAKKREKKPERGHREDGSGT